MTECDQEGQKDAREDIKAGTLKLKTLGLPAKWFREWQEILLQGYGVRVEMVDGCVVSDEEMDYAEGYNSISEAEIKSRFGANIFEKTKKKAEATQRLGTYRPRSS